MACQTLLSGQIKKKMTMLFDDFTQHEKHQATD